MRTTLLHLAVVLSLGCGLAVPCSAASMGSTLTAEAAMAATPGAPSLLERAWVWLTASLAGPGSGGAREARAPREGCGIDPNGKPACGHGSARPHLGAANTVSGPAQPSAGCGSDPDGKGCGAGGAGLVSGGHLP
jgi:hypothetical protein